MKPSDQLSLFPEPVQARKSAVEPRELWQVVQILRKAGHKVYRAGKAHHLVDGHRITEQKLVSLALTHKVD